MRPRQAVSKGLRRLAGGASGTPSLPQFTHITAYTTENLKVVPDSSTHLDPFAGVDAEKWGTVLTQVEVLAGGRIALSIFNGDGNTQRFIFLQKTDGTWIPIYLGRLPKDNSDEPEVMYESTTNVATGDEHIFLTRFPDLPAGTNPSNWESTTEPDYTTAVPWDTATLDLLKAQQLVIVIEGAGSPIIYNSAMATFNMTADASDYYTHLEIVTDHDFISYIETQAQDTQVAVHFALVNQGSTSHNFHTRTSLFESFADNENNESWSATPPPAATPPTPYYSQRVYMKHDGTEYRLHSLDLPEEVVEFPVTPPVEPQGLQKLYAMSSMFAGLMSGQPVAAHDFAQNFKDGLASGMNVGNPPSARPGIVNSTVSRSTAGYWNVPSNFIAGYSASTGPANNTPLDLPYMFYESSSPSSFTSINNNGWADIELDGGTTTGWLDSTTREGFEYDSKNWFSNTGLSERKLELVWNLTTVHPNKGLLVQELDADGNIIAGSDRNGQTIQFWNNNFYALNESSTETFGSWTHDTNAAGDAVRANNSTQVGNNILGAQELVTLYDGGWVQQIIPIHADTRKIRLRLRAAGRYFQNDLAFAEIALHGTLSSGGASGNFGDNFGDNF